MKELLAGKPGEKTILLGNEAIVRGALEAGVDFVSTFPGTPATEVGDIFSKLAAEAGVYFEYSTNEKVALEAGAGAAFCGLKALVAFKHFGLNVASDSLLPLAYSGIEGALVIFVSDDPGCWSSAQSEQDARYYAKMAHLPMFEPSDPEECKNFIKEAFQLSEKLKIPVFVRTTTRVSHQSAFTRLGEIPAKKDGNGFPQGHFSAGEMKFSTMPPRTLVQHQKLLDKIRETGKVSEKSKANLIFPGNGVFGAIVSGAGFNYLMDARKELGLKMPVLKLGLTYPLPEKKIKQFIKKLKILLVAEELEPYLEEQILGLAKDINPKLKIFGRDLLPKVGELKPEHLIAGLEKILGRKPKFNYSKHRKLLARFDFPKRRPTFCPGCPYWPVLAAIKKAAPSGTVIGGDIGCYMMAGLPPYNIQDYLISMGASIGVAHGVSKSSGQKVMALIGDSTFFHAGIPGLINVVYNKSAPLLIILENGTTAMTGHQPHPGNSIKQDSAYKYEWPGYPESELTPETPPKIEDIVRAVGIKNLKMVDSFKPEEMESAIREFLPKNEPCVIIARGMCALLAKKLKK